MVTASAKSKIVQVRMTQSVGHVSGAFVIGRAYDLGADMAAEFLRNGWCVREAEDIERATGGSAKRARR